MQPLNLKPSHKLVKSYYEALGQFGQLNIDHEMAVRSAFQGLLAGCGRQFDWTLVPEWPIQRPKAAERLVQWRPIGAMSTNSSFVHSVS